MPKNGFPKAMYCFIGSIRFLSDRACMADGAEPTPGNITASLFSIMSESDVVIGSTPYFSRALATLRRFPES